MAANEEEDANKREILLKLYLSFKSDPIPSD